MDVCELSDAIDELDVDKVKLLVPSMQSLIHLDNSVRYPPILECVMPEPIYEDYDDDEDSRRCEILKILVQHGADVNAQVKIQSWDEAYYDIRLSHYIEGSTPAMFAARWGYLKCLRFLTENGADLNMTSGSKLTALLMAVEARREKCVDYLTKHVPSLLLDHMDLGGDTALMLAASSVGENGLLNIRHLLAAGAKLEVENDRGYTPLTIAVEKKNIEAVRLLVDNGAQINTVRDDGETPLTVALYSGNPTIVMNLLSSGSDPTLSCKILERFHEDVAMGCNTVVQALVTNSYPPLDFQVTVLREDDDDETVFRYLDEMPISPLAMALIFDKLDIVRYFIANRFFTRFDILQLCWNPSLRRVLHHFNSTQSIEILDFLSRRPQSLFTLSLVAISTALSQEFVRLGVNMYSRHGGRDKWLFRPTFRERVNSLGLPPALKRTLLRQTPSSRICCQSWEDLPLF
ncbi:ankyrin repeat and SOCS box protein 3 [Elysia marginata]|uniref:Ankyrin repeat and SOCS box protein 3 n=1 Tax=Elysia marginata TaxID=1093978 RepID=A0AAV4FQA2_9GAST|nr:ankyrin repeat and SOCS box protein 3 [Elysia marginata]